MNNKTLFTGHVPDPIPQLSLKHSAVAPIAQETPGVAQAYASSQKDSKGAYSPCKRRQLSSNFISLPHFFALSRLEKFGTETLKSWNDKGMKKCHLQQLLPPTSQGPLSAVPRQLLSLVAGPHNSHQWISMIHNDPMIIPYWFLTWNRSSNSTLQTPAAEIVITSLYSFLRLLAD